MGVQLKGLDELKRALKDNCDLSDVKRVVQTNGDRLNREMKAQTHVAFVKGYSHGDTAGSINTEITDGGMTARVGPATEYAPYVEWGTRFMSAEPFVGPAFLKIRAQFIADMQRLMK